jgi:hypothetical protein
VLAGAAAAGAGAVAGLAGGTGVAQASGKPVELGEVNSANASTTINASKGTGLIGVTNTAKASGVAGIDDGTTDTGHGAYGRSTNGTGVYEMTGIDVTGGDGRFGFYGTPP